VYVAPTRAESAVARRRDRDHQIVAVVTHKDQRCLDVLSVLQGRHRVEAVAHRLGEPLQGQLGRRSIPSREQHADRTAVRAYVDLRVVRIISA